MFQFIALSQDEPADANLAEFTSLKNKVITVKTIDDTLLQTFEPPEKGWTIEAMGKTEDAINKLDTVDDGINAYMDNLFIGTTEI